MRAQTRRIRTIFISDVHLGCKHSRAAALAIFLEAHEPEHLFLVGDFIDGWKLRRSWRWLPDYNRILRRLLRLAEDGTRIYYTPGNHDDFLRQYLGDFGMVDVRDEFIFRTVSGQRLLVTHGDKFDRFEQSARWFTMLLTFVYDGILSLNRLASRFQADGRKRSYAFSASVKLLCKRFAMFVSDYERRLVDYAIERGCRGVVCGHIHKPDITRNDSVTYFNTGDWVEHCTALVEYQDGELELLFLLPNDANDRLDVVDRIAAPRAAVASQRDDWHDEFEDGFNHRDSSDADFPEFAPDARPRPQALPPRPRNRIRRLLRQLAVTPPTMACRGLMKFSRICLNPLRCRGFFVGAELGLSGGLPTDTLNRLDPTETT